MDDLTTSSAVDDFMDSTTQAEMRTALGLGTAATQASTAFAAASHTHAQSDITNLTTDLAAKAAASDLTSHTGNTSNPHSVTKSQVGLGNCDNTSDANKPISTATQTALDAKAASSHTHAATDVTSGTLDGDRLPAMSTTKRGGVPATGTPANKFLRDDATWQTISGGGDLLAANNLSDVANAATARTNLGLAIGTNVQAYDAELAAIAGLTSAADKGIQFTGSGTASTFDLTAAAKTVLDDTTVAAMVNTLGGASSTGTGGLVRATSPTLVTPALGTPSSGTLSNCDAFTGDSGSGGIKGVVPAPAAGDAAAGKYLKSDGTWATVAASGGGTKTYANLSPWEAMVPASNMATRDTRNGIRVLDFDDTTEESCLFDGLVMPEAASLGSGLKVRIHWTATSATSGSVRWGVQIERQTTDLDADSFDTTAEAHSTTSGTSGIITTTEITITTIDSLAAGEPYRLKLYRDVSDTTNDTMTGDAELVAVEVRSAA